MNILKHIKAYKTYKQTTKQRKSGEPKLEPIPQHKKSLELDLTIPFSQSNQQQNQPVSKL